MLRELLGSLVWLAANGLYIDFRRKGRRGWARIFFFWMGIPATWLWLFLIREGKEPSLPPPADDFDGLLAEVRRDKALRVGEMHAEALLAESEKRASPLGLKPQGGLDPNRDRTPPH